MEESSGALVKGAKEITSARNPRIMQVIGLRQRSARDAEGLMLVEGRVELRRALDNDIVPVTIFFSPEFLKDKEDMALIRRGAELGAELISCSSGIFEKITYREQCGGVLAVAPLPRRALDDIPVQNDSLFLLAESIEKPGNLGAILRSADAAVAGAVIVCDRRTDVYNPNVVRASLGTVFTVPVVEASSRDALNWLRRNKVGIVAATPAAETLYTDADLREKVAVAVGEEHSGLTGFWLNEADVKVRIPMRGQADSLNVAASAALLLFEAVRQRGRAISRTPSRAQPDYP